MITIIVIKYVHIVMKIKVQGIHVLVKMGVKLVISLLLGTKTALCDRYMCILGSCTIPQAINSPKITCLSSDVTGFHFSSCTFFLCWIFSKINISSLIRP